MGFKSKDRNYPLQTFVESIPALLHPTSSKDFMGHRLFVGFFKQRRALSDMLHLRGRGFHMLKCFKCSYYRQYHRWY